MSLLILTHENIEGLKREAREQMPFAKSSHLSEAIASALGFRTHAALRAKLAAEADLPPDVAECDSARFVIRLTELGYAAASAIKLAEVVRSGAVPDRPYAEFRGDDLGANNAHFAWCQRNNRPLLTISLARRYARLDWDCITIERDHEGFLFDDDQGRAFAARMFEQFQARTRGAPGKPYFTGSSFVGQVEKLLPETARQLAEDYFRMLYLPLREPREPRRKRAA